MKNISNSLLYRFAFVLALIGLGSAAIAQQATPAQDTLYIFKGEDGLYFAAPRAIALANQYDLNCAEQTVLRDDPNFHTPFDLPSDQVEGPQYFVRSQEAMAQSPKH